MVDVLELVLERSSASLRLSDISADLASPLSSTHDLLKSMAAAGLLRVEADRTYRIGPRFIQLAVSTTRSLDVWVLAHEHLEALAADLGHDVYLAVRLGDEVIYVDRIPGRGRATVHIRLGDPIPLHASAAGKLYCAFSPDLERQTLDADLASLTSRTITLPRLLADEFVRIRGGEFSISREETITGIIGAAVPVWASPGELLAAVHVSGLRDLVSDAEFPDLIAAMQRCAADIAQAMGREAVSGDRSRPADIQPVDRVHLQSLTARRR
ncbi:MAG: IclR family transcriptional regulator [Actinomycetes bacterium]